MTQIVLNVEMPTAKNPSSLSLGRHVIDDVTMRWGATYGRRDTAFQSIEKRFRADLRRRLRELRVQVEESRGRVARDPAGPGAMPTIAVRPPTGAWTMPRPPRRRCVSYQSVTHAVNSLTILSPRALSSSVPSGSRRIFTDSRTSLSDDPLTSPEVARSRESITSSTSDLSDVFAGSVLTVSDSDLSATNVVIAKSDKPQTAQRLYNTRLYSQEVYKSADVASRPITSSQTDRDSTASQSRSDTSAAARRPEIEEKIRQRQNEDKNHVFEALERQSSAMLQDLRQISTTGSRSPSRVPVMTQHRPEIATSALTKCVVMPGLSLSQTGTGSSSDERRLSMPEKPTFDRDVHYRAETVQSAATGDVDILQPSVRRGQSSCPQRLIEHIILTTRCLRIRNAMSI